MLRLVFGCIIVVLLLITYIVGLFKNMNQSHELLPVIGMSAGFLLGRSKT